MRYCCVPRCTGRGGFMFPRDPAIRARWIVAIRREGLVITPNTTVCHIHFREEDFTTARSFQFSIVPQNSKYILH